MMAVVAVLMTLVVEESARSPFLLDVPVSHHIFGAAEIRLELEDAFGQNIYR